MENKVGVNSTSFLSAVQGHAESRLSEAEAHSLVNELRNHLELSAAARVELGTEPAEAERQAVNELGDPRLIVKKLYDQKHRWVDKKFAGLLMGMYVLSAGMLAYGEHVNAGTPQFPNIWLTTLWFVGIGMVIWCSA